MYKACELNIKLFDDDNGKKIGVTISQNGLQSETYGITNLGFIGEVISDYIDKHVAHNNE